MDAAFFHLYLPAEPNGEWSPAENETAEDRARLKASFPSPRDAVAYIMDTFPIVKRKDEEKWGEYRTKRVILEIYDAMAEADPHRRLLSDSPCRLRPRMPPSLIPGRLKCRSKLHILPDPLEELSAVANAAWGTPLGVSPDNVALFTLIEVMRILGGPVDSERVRVACESCSQSCNCRGIHG